MRPERYAGAGLGRASLYIVLGSLDCFLSAKESFEAFFFSFFF